MTNTYSNNTWILVLKYVKHAINVKHAITEETSGF